MSLACNQTKWLFLNDEPCMVRPTHIDLNPAELKYYPFMSILNKCMGSCSILSPKICVLKKTKDITFIVFDMIKNKNEAKTMTNETN